MSSNIDQIFIANPASSMLSTDLTYLGRSPFGAGNNMAITWANTILSIRLQLPNFVEVTGTTQSMSSNTSYRANNASLVTFTLPASAAIGSYLEIIGEGAGGWGVVQNAGQNIRIGTVISTTSTGSIASSNRYDAIRLICTVANTSWAVCAAPQSASISFDVL